MSINPVEKEHAAVIDTQIKIVQLNVRFCMLSIPAVGLGNHQGMQKSHLCFCHAINRRADDSTRLTSESKNWQSKGLSLDTPLAVDPIAIHIAARKATKIDLQRCEKMLSSLMGGGLSLLHSS